jgi:hypothetical protein
MTWLFLFDRSVFQSAFQIETKKKPGFAPGFLFYRSVERRLLQFAMNRVATEIRVVLLLLETLGVCLSVLRRRVT